ncbi:MAG TPA: hypothetical protein VEW68_04755, partial [Patescibacteria group bacterium]|nr:hypothetical protein [Patescibacteria group bacterium]
AEGLIGLLAALGGDAPELSSAVVAILAGAGDVGVGVVVGSNLFNLAALLGLSAVVVGGISVRRGPMLVDAAAGLAVTVVAAGLAGGLVAAPVAAVAAFAIFASYALILGTPATLGRRLGDPLARTPLALAEAAYEIGHDMPETQHRSWAPVYLLPLAVGGVLAGSYLMVREALAAAPLLHLSSSALGTVVLAALTSLPNLWVALHFARNNRGTALFSAAMNSNTINLLGGLIVPALFAGTAMSRGALGAFGLLLAMTVLATVAPIPRGRLRPITGASLIALYLVFAAVKLAGA